MKHRWISVALTAVILGALLMLPSTTRASSQAPYAPTVSTTIVISEFRTLGPNAGTDEFIELFNLSAAAVNISAWQLWGSNNNLTPGVSMRVTIPAGTTLNPGCRYLIANTGYLGSPTADLTYSTGIQDNGGIAICSGTCNTVANRVDQVGMGINSAYQEGTILPPLSGNTNQSYERMQPLGTSPYNGQDTDNNVSDFFKNSVSSNPQNSSSSCTPLAVTLATFAAAATPAGVILGWETVSETDNAGFNVYRAAGDLTGFGETCQVCAWARLNAALIPAAAPGASGGHAYTWVDATAQANTAYVYRLESVALDGTAEVMDVAGVTYRPAQRRWLPLLSIRR